MRKCILILIIFFLLGCKTSLENQKIDKKKEGKWVNAYVEDNVSYEFIEYYKKDQPVKKWKTYVSGKIYKTERYKRGICIVKIFHQNGKIESKGKTKLEINNVETHWFYQGKWKFYDEKGKLIKVKLYNKGELISEENIK